MKQKLTLLIEKEIIENAKVYARKQNTSISKLVEIYLEALSDPIHQFGKHPVDTEIKDGSKNHNRYIYS